MERKVIFGLFIFFLTVYIIAMYLLANSMRPKLTVPEKIMESVVFVNTASGTVIYSDDKKTLILTAYHVVSEDIIDDGCLDCNSDIEVRYLYFTNLPDSVKIEEELYRAKKTFLNKRLDLALIEIVPHKKVVYSKIIIAPKDYPKLGSDIWIGANPNGNYRSLKKGILSATKYRISNYYIPVWEVSGGVVFGSSGGGVFDESGRLFGVVKSVNMLFTDQCFDKTEGIYVSRACVEIPQSFIALITPPDTIREFLLSSPYWKYFWRTK